MEAQIIIGKNFGDEGKGLATDYFARQAQQSGKPCLVVRHNGGAQAGHTVDRGTDRFVFHQLSSGSFRGADTLWADSFLPDLYKLREEAEDFFALSGKRPRILSGGDCRCVVIDDVLLNMALETARGSNRHGSCGMGINEAVQRSKTAFLLTLREVRGMTADALYRRLREIRSGYTAVRLKQTGLDRLDSEYASLLRNDNVLRNAAEGMCRSAALTETAAPSELSTFESVIFEGAQGLLLDENYLAYAPHLTTSRTGLQQPLALCRELFPAADCRAVYVTRSYVTRHGAGPLPYEGQFDRTRYPVSDPTNLPNEWQGKLRFAPHGNHREFLDREFLDPVLADKGSADVACSLFLTHLNETDGRVVTAVGALPLAQWADAYRIFSCFDNVYLSASPFSRDVTLRSDFP